MPIRFILYSFEVLTTTTVGGRVVPDSPRDEVDSFSEISENFPKFRSFFQFLTNMMLSNAFLDARNEFYA